ncbi:MAG: aldo/keto reductase family protein [Bacteroidia bacterium]|nr:aldo/keto reductase family protein [Bacteroidia bacterium]
MQYRQLGQSGLWISEISLGTWLTFGTAVNTEESFRCLDIARNLGINFIDTADVYNQGAAEELLGNYLQTVDRETVIIGTKVFGPMGHTMKQGLSHRHITNAVQASLRRLRTDYIDLYQCHRYDIDTPLEETCYAMNRLIEQGYILHWGVSQWSAVQILQAIRVCERHHWQKPISNQPIYNLLNRSLEVSVMELCEVEKIGLVVYSPLAQGLLTGKYSAHHIPEDSRAANQQTNAWFPQKRLTQENFDKIDKLTRIAHQLGITMSQLALAWVLRKKPITSAIIGASKSNQVIENCKAVGVTLSEEILSDIEIILDNHPKDQYTGEKIGHGIVKRGY